MRAPARVIDIDIVVDPWDDGWLCVLVPRGYVRGRCRCVLVCASWWSTGQGLQGRLDVRTLLKRDSDIPDTEPLTGPVVYSLNWARICSNSAMWSQKLAVSQRDDINGELGIKAPWGGMIVIFGRKWSGIAVIRALIKSRAS